MFQIKLTDEQKAKAEAVEAKRKSVETARDEAATNAYAKAFDDVGCDASKLIVHELPEGFGGGVIHRLPSKEEWTILSRRSIRDFASKVKDDDHFRAVAHVIENPKLLIYPPLNELQALCNELPGLYAKIHDTIENRCNNGNYLGKGTVFSSEP